MPVKPEFGPLSLGGFLPYQITFLAHQIARRTATIAKDKDDDLNLSHWRVLAAVAEKQGRTANEVVSVTPMDKGIVSRAVKSLIDKRLIERKASNEDGRIGRLFLTEQGAAVYSAIAQDVSNVERQMMAMLSESEKRAISSALQKLSDGFSK